MSESNRAPWSGAGKETIIKTPQEWAAEASGGGPVRCPGCGRVLFAYKTETSTTVIFRYEECRTPGCERRFVTKQPHRTIVKEITSRKVSSAGNTALQECEES